MYWRHFKKSYCGFIFGARHNSPIFLIMVKIVILQYFNVFLISVCDENDGTMSSMPTAPVHSILHSQRTSTIPRPPAVPVTLTGLNYSMPVDDEQYLLPSSSSPHSKNTPTNNNNPYMELVGDTANQNGFGGQQPPSMFQYPPPPYLVDHPSNYGRGPDQQSM